MTLTLLVMLACMVPENNSQLTWETRNRRRKFAAGKPFSLRVYSLVIACQTLIQASARLRTRQRAGVSCAYPWLLLGNGCHIQMPDISFTSWVGPHSLFLIKYGQMPVQIWWESLVFSALCCFEQVWSLFWCSLFSHYLLQYPGEDKVLKVTLKLLLYSSFSPVAVVCGFYSKVLSCSAGGSLASNVLSCQRELEHFHIHKTRLTEVGNFDFSQST